MREEIILFICIHTDKLPVDSGEYLVLLADRKLLDLPLESLLILRGEGVISISRDFSLQLLHSRLNGEELERGMKTHSCPQ